MKKVVVLRVSSFIDSHLLDLLAKSGKYVESKVLKIFKIIINLCLF